MGSFESSRRWVVAAEDDAADRGLAAALGVRPLVARLLRNRGLSRPEDCEPFLECSLAKHLRSPMLFREMPAAAERLLRAVRTGERMTIYGDYDVDGITGATQLVLFLRELGAKPEVFIPHRLRDGYGLSRAALERIADGGTKLVVTADCGAAAHEEIAAAERRGIDVIVCDHHQNPDVRPPAYAVLNPVVADAGFPFHGLSAAGVVFYLLLGTRMRIRESGSQGPDLRRLLDLVALGTVADMVPLVEENRVLVKYGLRELARSSRAGVRALMQVAGVDEVTADSVGFRLGPRLNASGRLDDATRAVELLATSEPETARALASALDGHNANRRELDDVAFQEAEAAIRAMTGFEERRSFVVASEGWHPGVVGIVASRLVERFFRPTIVIALEGEVGRGSARSIPAVHLHEVLRRCASSLERFGGHRAAAGLTIRRGEIDRFRERFEDAVAAATRPEDFVARLAIDARVTLGDLDERLLEDLARLEPCGLGNAKPLLAVERVEIVSRRIVGERHLKLVVREPGTRRTFDAIAFRKARDAARIGAFVDLAFRPEVHRFEGWESIQLVVEDLRNPL